VVSDADAGVTVVSDADAADKLLTDPVFWVTDVAESLRDTPVPDAEESAVKECSREKESEAELSVIDIEGDGVLAVAVPVLVSEDDPVTVTFRGMLFGQSLPGGHAPAWSVVALLGS
jgi:hypothetical protein